MLYNRTVWLYPDLTTAMLGHWDEVGEMVEGRAGRVTAVHCNSEGIMILQTEPVPGSKSYKYDPPTDKRISSNPLDSDQYEVKHVTVKKSKYVKITVGCSNNCLQFRRRRNICFEISTKKYSGLLL